MANYGGVTFTGKSGEKYYFHAWPLGTRFKSVGAVYFVTKRVFNNTTYGRRASHEGVYIGQTGNLNDPFSTQSQLGCFKKHGADCVCVYMVPDEQRRLVVARDLIAGHSTTCNDEWEDQIRGQPEAAG
jgi:hypothetical protein